MNGIIYLGVNSEQAGVVATVKQIHTYQEGRLNHPIFSGLQSVCSSFTFVKRLHSDRGARGLAARCG